MRYLVSLMLLAGCLGAARGAENLVANGDFAAVDAQSGFAQGWDPEIHTAQGAQGSLAVEAGALKILHTSDSSAWVRASQEPLAAQPDHLYLLRCRVRGDAPYSLVAYEYLAGAAPDAKPVGHTLSQGAPGDAWKPAALAFRTAATAARFKLSLIAAGKGTLWFDDVELRDLSEAPDAVVPAAPASVRLDPFLKLGGDGKESTEPTAAMVSYDAGALLIRFECHEAEPGKMVAQEAAGSPVYQDDCVEIFIEPEGWSGGHCQVAVNSRGVVWANRTGGAGFFTRWWAPAFRPGAWQPKITATARVEKERWTADVRIPWADLETTPHAGMPVRANLTRRRLVGGEENASWAPMRGATFHDSSQWGRLILAADGSGRSLHAVAGRPSLAPLPAIPDPKSPKPAFAVRAFHSQAPLKTEVEAYKQLVRFLARLKYNTLVLEVNDRLKYESHPEIASSSALSKEEMRALVRYCRDLGFEVIPQVQTFGHCNFILNRHPELAENKEPDPRQGLWSYCPSNPAVYDLVFDLFAEVIDVFQCRQFHIGHDEFTFVPVGVCDRCRGTSPADLLARDVTKLHDWLVARGQRVLMWGDTLLADQYGGPRNYNTCLALPKIPRDIVIYDWHYPGREDYPSARLFREAGFRTVECGWFDPVNIQNLARAGLAAGADGYCFTTWYGVNRMADTSQLMAATLLSAQYAWDPKAMDLDAFPPNPVQLYRRLYDPERFEQRTRARFATVDLGASAVLDRADTPFAAAPAGLQWLEAVPYALGEKVAAATERAPKLWQVPVGGRVSALHFLHATSRPARIVDHLYDQQQVMPAAVGRYVIHYADGSRAVVPLVYRRNISDWNSKLGAGECDLAWQGQRGDGSLVTLCAYEWQNPNPDRPVVAVDVERTSDAVDLYLLALTASPAP